MKNYFFIFTPCLLNFELECDIYILRSSAENFNILGALAIGTKSFITGLVICLCILV